MPKCKVVKEWFPPSYEQAHAKWKTVYRACAEPTDFLERECKDFLRMGDAERAAIKMGEEQVEFGEDTRFVKVGIFKNKALVSELGRLLDVYPTVYRVEC